MNPIDKLWRTKCTRKPKRSNAFTPNLNGNRYLLLVLFWVSNYEKTKSTNSFSWRTISASYFTVLYRKWYTQSVCSESSLVCCTSLLRHKVKWIFYNFRQMTGTFWLYLTPSLSRTRIWFVCKLVVLLSVVYTFNYWKKNSNDIQSDGDDIRRNLSSDWLTRAGNAWPVLPARDYSLCRTRGNYLWPNKTENLYW